MKRSYFAPFFAPLLAPDGSESGADSSVDKDIEEDVDTGDDGGDEDVDEDSDDGDEEGSDEDSVDSKDDDPFKDYVHKDQVSKIVSERVNKLNEKVKKGDSAVAILDTIATLTGVPVDQVAGQLQEAAANALANNKKISIEEARKEISKQIKAADDAKLSKMLNLEKQEIQMLKHSDKYPAYEAFADEIKETAADKGVSLEDAYILVTSRKSEVMDNYKKSNPQKKKAGEVKDKTAPKGGGAPKNTKPTVIKSIDKKAAEGLTEEDILAYQDAETSYDAMLKKHGGK